MRDLEIRGAGNLLGDEQSGHVAALGFELYMQMLDEAVQAAAGADGDGAEEEWEPVRLDVNVDAYVPADYIPYEQAKVDVHRRIAGAREVADLALLREELEDRFGELPEPLENLIALQHGADQARAGRARRAVTFRGGRLAVTPIELDSVRAKRLRAEIPEALYESGKSQLSMRVPEDPRQAVPGGRAGRRRAAVGVHARGRAVRRVADRHRARVRDVTLVETPSASIRPDVTRDVSGRLLPSRADADLGSRFAALGAFFVVAVGIAGCGSGIPGNSVAVGRRQPDHDPGVQPLDVRRRQGPGGAEPRRAGDRAQRPAELHKPASTQVRQQIPALAKTSDKTLKTDCDAALHVALEPGHGLPDRGLLVPGRRPQAGHQGHRRRRSRRRSPQAKKQQFPTTAAFKTFLSQTGQTYADIIYRIRVNQIYTKLLVTRHEDGHAGRDRGLLHEPPDRSSGPRRRATCGSSAPTTQAQAARGQAALKTGQSWDTVAKKYSTDPTTKNNGGQLTGVTRRGGARAQQGRVRRAAEQARRSGPGHRSATTCSR